MTPHLDMFNIRRSYRDKEEIIFSDRLEGYQAERMVEILTRNGNPPLFVGANVIITPMHEDGECQEQIGRPAVLADDSPLPASTQHLGSPTRR